MAMTVVIENATGAGPTWGTVTAVKWNREDTAAGTTVIPTPTSTGTNFSFVKSLMINITVTDSLSMTDVTFGKVAAETTTGTLLWYNDDAAEGGYAQATVAPSSTGDNNATPPDINAGATEASVPLISSGDTYSAGPHSTTGRKGNIIEVTLGVDATNTDAGSTVATPTLRWEWTES